MTKMDSEDWYSWDEFYKQNKIEEMPWFEKELDKDVDLEIRKIKRGKFLIFFRVKNLFSSLQKTVILAMA